jgi:hypothetical protein
MKSKALGNPRYLIPIVPVRPWHPFVRFTKPSGVWTKSYPRKRMLLYEYSFIALYHNKKWETVSHTSKRLAS